MYIISMILGLLLIITVVGMFYYELINDHFENVYTEKYYEYKKTKLEEVKDMDQNKMDEIAHIQKNVSWYGPVMIISWVLM